VNRVGDSVRVSQRHSNLWHRPNLYMVHCFWEELSFCGQKINTGCCKHAYIQSLLFFLYTYTSQTIFWHLLNGYNKKNEHKNDHMILTGEAHQALGLWSECDIMCFGKWTNALSQMHACNLSLLSRRFVTVGYYWLLVPIYQSTRCHTAEDHKLHINCHKNPQISYNVSSYKFTIV
jgi:hypothetical protein